MPLVSIHDVSRKTFDYVIIGGGTAGLTLAARLTEDPDVTVLVLEAGQANIDDPAILRPASYASHFGQPQYDWGHKTVPQKHCNGTVFQWPRGKGLGGSSATNFLCWTRPPGAEIDDIERLGNPGWNWATMKKYASKSEKFVTPPAVEAEKWEWESRTKGWTLGSDGPIKASFPGNLWPAELEFQKSMLKLGFDHAKDPLGGDPKGIFFNPQTVDPITHTRSYATNGFYLPAKDRKNLTVLTDALVHRIVTEPGKDAKKILASMVELEYEGKVHAVKIWKEVVVCAGGLKTPQILELSGIGTKEVLEKLEIPVKVELPVGKNAQEHNFMGVTYELKDDVPFDTLDNLRNPGEIEKQVRLHAQGTGIFTMGLMGFTFAPLQNYSPAADAIHAEVEQHVLKSAKEGKYDDKPGLLEQYKIQIERTKRLAPGCEIVNFPGFLSYPNPPSPGKKYFTLLCAMNHQWSRGTVHCTTKDPNADPEYDPHYFEEDIDLKTFVECIKFARRLKDVAPFKDMIVTETNPGPNITTDEQIGDWLKQYMSTTFHTSSTASMLPRDKGGVVDSEFKVYGTENIRVCDMSVCPLQFAAHPQAFVYSIAEMAADVIKGKLKLSA